MLVSGISILLVANIYGQTLEKISWFLSFLFEKWNYPRIKISLRKLKLTFIDIADNHVGQTGCDSCFFAQTMGFVHWKRFGPVHQFFSCIGIVELFPFNGVESLHAILAITMLL